MRIYAFFFCILSLGILSADAQDRPVPSGANRTVQPKQSLRDRLFFGGNVGLNFGSLTFIMVSPTVGYRVDEKLSVGIGPTYSYYSDNRNRSYKYETHTYGGRFFTQYRLHESIMLYSEYEMLNMEVPDLLFSKLERRNISSLFVGGGYMQPIGKRSALTLMLLYNVLESDYAVYENPIIRTGFMAGF